jgi:Tol biopolymer transport system component
MRPLTLILVALCALQSFGQTIEVKPFEAIKAKAVKVEQLPDSVAVILTDRAPGMQTGAYVQVTSKAKWATPLLDGINITRTQQPGEWVLFAPSGRYRMLLAEFDPETGPNYTFHDLVIGSVKPDDPDPKPPVGDLEQLKKVAKELADAKNDPLTRRALVTAYRSIDSMAGKSYDEMVAGIKMARRAAGQSRQGDARAKDWSDWLAAVDAELQKVVKPGDAVGYSNAVKAIADALGQ